MSVEHQNQDPEKPKIKRRKKPDKPININPTVRKPAIPTARARSPKKCTAAFAYKGVCGQSLPRCCRRRSREKCIRNGLRLARVRTLKKSPEYERVEITETNSLCTRPFSRTWTLRARFFDFSLCWDEARQLCRALRARNWGVGRAERARAHCPRAFSACVSLFERYSFFFLRRDCRLFVQRLGGKGFAAFPAALRLLQGGEFFSGLDFFEVNGQ